MKKFMQTHQVYLTPLSPIHIGCGEDFEPTNYVIKDNKLYCFEASKLGLSEQQRNHLIKICKDISEDSIQEIQTFFAQNGVIELAIQNAYSVIPVSAQIAREWKDKLGKTVQFKGNGQKEFNALEIARNSYIPYSNSPYIPSSSLKGALITAFLNNRNCNDKNKAEYVVRGNIRNKEAFNEHLKALNTQLINRYIGDFSQLDNADEKILSQRIKFSDFTPSNDNQKLSKVMYAVNVKRTLGKDRNAIKNLSVRRECIQPLRFRAFSSSLTLLNDNNIEKLTLSDLVNSLNEFNLPILIDEYQTLIDNNICNDRNYVENIKTLLKSENTALIRLGRSGSEAKVYRNHDLRSISVNNEPSKESHTLWIASDSKEKSETMQPFGWALLEFIDDEEENPLLEKWCQNSKVSLANFQKQLDEERVNIAIQKAKEDKLGALPENHRKVIELKDKFNASNEKQIDNSSALLKEVRALIENEAVNWEKEDKQFMAENITKELIIKRVELKKKNAEKDLNKLLRKLVAE